MGELVSLPSPRDLSQLAARKWALLTAASVDRRIGDFDFRILFVMLDVFLHRHAGDRFGLMWPSVPAIAGLILKDQRSVRRAIRRLMDLQYLCRVSRGGGRLHGGASANAVYSLPAEMPAPGLNLSPTPGLNLSPESGLNLSPAPGLNLSPESAYPIEDTLEDSDAVASGAVAPIDPVKGLWDRGLAILGKGQRSLFGKMRRTYGDPAVLAAIVECENTYPSDPPAYFVACCQRGKGNGRNVAAAAEHAHALDILGKAALDHDERKGNRGAVEAVDRSARGTPELGYGGVDLP
jgi:hypothetical protein